jgi:replicative DNA helicase
LDSVGGAYYISQLTNRIASAAHAESHARIVVQKYILREMIRISGKVIQNAYDETTDVFNLLDEAESELFKVTEGNIRKDYESMASLLFKAQSEIEIAMQKEDGINGVGSGFKELDKITSGWQKSDMIVIAARPGMGKTAFVLSMARNIAVDYEHPVAIFSLEMSSIQLVNRLISGEAEIPADDIRRGNFSKSEFEQFFERTKSLSEAPIYIDDTPALSIFELRAKSRRLKQQHGVQLIIIDYLQLMSSGGKGGNREQEISNISRSIKEIAKELEIPIIALSQLSRSVETRGGDKRPMLSDLRDSGAIEQDADIVGFIYRPEYYQLTEWPDGSPCNNQGEIIIAKHRNGSLKDVRLKFIGKYAKFSDLDGLSQNDFMYNAGMKPNNDFGDDISSFTMPSKMNDDSSNEDPF